MELGAGNDHADINRQITDRGNKNDTSTNNIEQERQCGDVDYRLKKKGSLNAVSRDVILNQTAHLRKENPEADFTKIKPSAVRYIQLIKLHWKERQEQCKAESLTQKGE